MANFVKIAEKVSTTMFLMKFHNLLNFIGFAILDSTFSIGSMHKNIPIKNHVSNANDILI